jgi:hypothetical protein
MAIDYGEADAIVRELKGEAARRNGDGKLFTDAAEAIEHLIEFWETHRGAEGAFDVAQNPPALIDEYDKHCADECGEDCDGRCIYGNAKGAWDELSAFVYSYLNII